MRLRQARLDALLARVAAIEQVGDPGALPAHIVGAVRGLVEADRVIAALERAATVDGHGVVVLGATGRARHVTPLAATLLRDWFPAAPSSRATLPDGLRAWARARLEAGTGSGFGDEATFALARGDRRLTVRFLPAAPAGDPPLLVLDEARPAFADGALRALGLTRREADVLRLVAQGAANGEVARALCLSPATVKKHLEHVYRKLGVGSRGAAVAAVHRAGA